MSKRKTSRRRRNPRGTMNTLTNLVVLGGLGFAGVKGYQYLKANPTALDDLAHGKLPGSTPAPAPLPAAFATDTGYSTSQYGSTPV